MERYDRVVDSATPAAELASLLAEHYGGLPVSSQLTELMLAKGSSPSSVTRNATCTYFCIVGV
ncbi:MAG: hypothetical protein ACRDRJ_48975 [Streptosporangiaceae bacterium]